MNDYEAKKFEIQEELIAIINDRVEVEPDLIRFWKPEERMEEEKIMEEYPTIYSVDVVFEYGKSTKLPLTKTYVEKNFELYNANNKVSLVFIGLDPVVLAELRKWSRNAAYEIYKYFRDEELYYLRQLRFDFLPTSKNQPPFCIPNLPLENILLSPRKKGKIIDTKKYVMSKILTAEEIQHLEKSLQERESSS